MSEIFISYSSKDRMFVDSLIVESSKYKNLKFWASHKGVSSGENFKEKIEKKIDEAKSAVIFVSKNSLDSEFINDVELPKLFEKKEKNKNFKIHIVLLDESDHLSNKYFQNIHLFNSPTTHLQSLSSSQLGIIFNELCLALVDNSKKFNKKVVLATAVIIPLVAISLYVFNINNSEIVKSEQSVIQPEVVEELNMPENIDEVADIKLCFDEEVGEIYSENTLYNPVKNELLPVVDCQEPVNSFTFYSKNLKLTQEELSDVLVEQLNDESITECADKFEIEFGYSSNETLYDWIYIYVESLGQELYLYCSVVLKEVDSLKVANVKFNVESAYLDIFEYVSNLGIVIKDFESLVVGDCFNHMTNFYGSEANAKDQGLLDTVFKISCDYPHDIEFFKEFKYTRSSGQTMDDLDLAVSNLCDSNFAINYTNLDYFSKRTPEGYPVFDVYYNYKVSKAEKYEEFRVYCLVGQSYLLDIKSEVSVINLLEKKVFKNQSIQEENDFVEIETCDGRSLEAVGLESDDWIVHDIKFNWNVNSDEIRSIYFYFEDFDYFLDYLYTPSETELRYINNWGAMFPMGFYAEDSNDKAIVRVEITLENDTTLTNECIFDLEYLG